MRSEMFERIAAAIELILVEYKDEMTTSGMARMATGYVLEAMREPTKDMIDACDINIPTTGMITGIWDSMIDAALTPSTQA